MPGAEGKSFIDPVWAVALLAIAAGLAWALTHLGARSFWFDELFSIAAASPATPSSAANAIITGDVHPPGYYYGLRAWLALLHSDTEVAARSFNLIALALCAWAALWAVRAKIDAPIALWCALFFTSFGWLWYLQEARMYAFLIASGFMTCVLALGFDRADVAKPSPAYATLAVVTFVVLPTTHWFAGFYSGLVLLGLFVLALMRKKNTFALLFLGCGLAQGAMAATWIAMFWSSTGGALAGYEGPGTALWVLKRSFIGVLLFAFTFNPILIFIAARKTIRVGLSPMARPALALVVLTALLVPVVILLISLYAPMNQTRNFMGAIGPATLVAAIGVERMFGGLNWSPTRRAIALALLLGIGSLAGLSADRLYPGLERDDWRAAGEYVRSIPVCADAPIAVSAYWKNRDEPSAAVNAEMRIYGHYAGHIERMRPVYRDDKSIAADVLASPCPIKLWVGHANLAQAEARAARAGVTDGAGYRAVGFKGGVLFVKNDGN